MPTPIQLNDDEARGLADVLVDALAQAEADRAEYIEQLNENRALFKNAQERTDAPFAGACNLHVPLLRYTSNALAAREVRALLGTSPYVFVEGRSARGLALAEETENFLYEQLRRQLHFRDIWRPVIQEANDDGCSVTYYRWKTRQEKKLHYVAARQTVRDPETGAVLEQAGQVTQKRVPVITYDGPEITRLPIEFVGTYPAAMADLQESQGVYVRMTETGNDLLAKVISGDYGKRAVERLRDWTAKGNTGQMRRSDEENAGIDISDASVNVDRSFHNTPFEITEWYWRYPRSKNEPAEDWLITLHADSRTVLRAIPNPWGHGRRPIVVSRILPAKYGIIGTSVADISGNTQRFITLLLRLMVDGMTWRTNPAWAFGAGVTPDEFKKLMENLAPGYKFRTNSEDLGKAIQQFGEVGVDPQAVISIIEVLRSYDERALLADVFRGQAQPRNVTATEVEQMLTEGQELILDMTDTLAESMRQAAELILELDYQFATHASIEELWRVANPQSLIPPYLALAETYDLEAAGTRQTSNAALKRQRAVELFTVLKDDPFVNADPSGRRQYALRKLLVTDGFGQRAPQALIGREEEAPAVPIVQRSAEIVGQAAQIATMTAAANAAGPSAAQNSDGGMHGQNDVAPGATGLDGAAAMPGLGAPAGAPGGAAEQRP
ncbi:MAG: portal protein [Armatimonadota bacterium]